MEPKLKAYLSLIAWSEATSSDPLTKNDGYDVIVTGIHGGSVFTDYSTHPFADGRPPVQWHLDPPAYSTAAGRYQELLHNYLIYKVQLKLPDFSPASQDKIAIQQIGECNALHLIAAGDIEQAIIACKSRWASFPGADYANQTTTHTMADFLDKYAELRG